MYVTKVYVRAAKLKYKFDHEKSQTKLFSTVSITVSKSYAAVM